MRGRGIGSGNKGQRQSGRYEFTWAATRSVCALFYFEGAFCAQLFDFKWLNNPMPFRSVSGRVRAAGTIQTYIFNKIQPSTLKQ